jgi:sugar phosphate isomerase/epimerase
MKRCISNIAWSPDKNEEVISLLKDHDIQYIEVAPNILFDNPIEVTAHQLLAVKDYWAQKGIKLYGMQALLYGNPHLKLFESAESRRYMFEYLKKIVRLAGRLDIKTMVFGSPKNRLIDNITPEQVLSVASDFFSKISETCYEHGVILCLEPNAKGYGCNFINNTEEALKLINEVNHSNFQLNMDTSTLIMNSENLKGSILKAKDNIAHFHISAPNLTPVSSDIIDFQLTSDLLKKIKYEGAVSIEMRPTTIPNIKKALELLENHFR